MKASEIRQKFLNFFKENKHTIVLSSSLLPQDPSVLFTTAGMQQFKPYYLGEASPYGKNTASSQKCIRTSDIDEVGDESHLTFFEMLGNFSFGGYFKKEAIVLAHQFITQEMGLEIDYVTIFDPGKIDASDWRKGVPKDNESYDIWKKKVKLPEKKIKGEGIDNFWGPTGNEGPCGPTTEIYIKSEQGKSIEIWNIVFNEYFCDVDKNLKKLETPGVDTGMGLERLAIMMQKVPTVFETDLFSSVIEEMEEISKKKYSFMKGDLGFEKEPSCWADDVRAMRIIADHVKSSVFLASEGVLPSNVEQGYVLRRLLRRAVRYGKMLNMPKGFLIPLAEKAIDVYADIYSELKERQKDIVSVIEKEEEKFEKTIEGGLRNLDKIISSGQPITGAVAFDIYQTYGLPLEVAEEILSEKGKKVEKPEEFELLLKKHQEISRAGAEKKFGGVGKEAGSDSAKLHTATHLLHQALREVLGPGVKQMGSDVTPERLRFDFAHPVKMTPEEIKRVEEIVNEKIKEDLEVKKEEMPYEKAVESGALAFFKQKYPPIVNVFSVGDFSKEICAGPHVVRTSELGKFKILKEESSSAGVRRIRAVLE